MNARRLRDDEKQLILRMLGDLPEGKNIVEKIDHYEVEEMDDGGMGSIRVTAPNECKRHFARLLAEIEFGDKDGAPIFVSVIVDSTGEFYELDFWKVDFSPRRTLEL